jgi:general secretion pathway protein C
MEIRFVAGSLLKQMKGSIGGGRFVSLYTLLAAVLLTFAMVQGARFMWALFTPVAPVGNWKVTQASQIPEGARAELFAAFDPFYRTEIAATTDAEKITSLPVKLFGIRSNEASGSGSAIIADAAGLQNSFATGEEIMPGVILNSVAFDHVVLSNNGSIEKLYLDQSIPATSVGGKITRLPGVSSAPTSSSNAGSAPVAGGTGSGKLSAENVAKNVGLAPRNSNGQVTGLVVSARDDGSVLRAAGLKDGDIIVSVNGRKVGSSADIAQQLRPGARMSIEVERGAEKVPMSINLEK